MIKSVDLSVISVKLFNLCMWTGAVILGVYSTVHMLRHRLIAEPLHYYY